MEKNSVITLCLYLFLISIFISCKQGGENISSGDDWYSYQHDNRNSGISSAQLNFPLKESWVNISRHAPNPAWPMPAEQDYWHQVPKLSPLITYDRAFHITTMNDQLYFASSADNKIYCLNADTGREEWSFFTGAPNRIAPVLYEEKVYAGSDDGYLYCLSASDGKLIWKYKAAGSDRKIIGNGRMISVCPVRTGCIVRNDTVFFAAGIFPKQEVYIISLDAENGNLFWKKKQDAIVPQGYPVASDRQIIFPNSRSRPYAFDLQTGMQIKRYTGGPGGDYVGLSDEELTYGVSNSDEITGDDFLETALSGHKVITSDDAYYIASNYRLTAIKKDNYKSVLNQRNSLKKKLDNLTSGLRKDFSGSGEFKENKFESTDVKVKIDSVSKISEQLKQLEGKEFLWVNQIVNPYSVILTKDAVLVGMKDSLCAYSVSDGRLLWTGMVDGCAYGLSVSHQKLFVSTDKGKIYCFSSGKRRNPMIVQTKNNRKQFKNSEYYRRAAGHFLEQSDNKMGFCLVLDCNEGGLAYELAEQSDMQIICVEKDEGKVRKLRKKFDRAGLYGKRITIFQGSLKELAFTDYFANLVVSDKFLKTGEFVEAPGEIFRVMRPDGGIAIFGQQKGKKGIIGKRIKEWIGDSGIQNWSLDEKNGIWLKIKRDKLPGSGEWTHLYANNQNTASSSDKLVNDNLVPQWFGRPGPRKMADRHHRAVAPLYKNGTVYIPGYARLMAADAYNGTLLWDKVIPEFRRLGIFRDACNMAVSDDLLYVALTSHAVALNPKTGQEEKKFVMPQLLSRDTRYWGYLAVQDNKLVGSARKPEAEFSSMSWQDDNELWYDYQRSVTSDYLVCLDRHTGEKLWTYQSGILLNSTITVGNDRIYFLESHNPVALKDTDGLLQLEDVLGKNSYLVAIDLQSGELLWKKHLDISVKRHSIFLSYNKEMLIAVSAKNVNKLVYYDVYGFSAENGDLIWHQEQNNEKRIGGGHGEQHLHPAIAGNKVYAEPYAYDLFTGNPLNDFKLVRNGHGCGTISASENNLFYRAANPALCNLKSDETTKRINLVNRPGCWINIIPAGGLVLIPEASSGCTCDYPLQMSIAYLPLTAEMNKN